MAFGRPLLGVLFWLIFLGSGLHAQSLVDVFAERESTSSPNDSVRANNARATLEPFEPRHGGKPGGHSLWIEWTATSTGIATFSTEGSNFDTLLSAYVLDAKDPDKPPLDRLKEVARSDDFEKSKTSLIQFGAVAGTTYQIAVDGYEGSTGDIRLRWDLIRSDAPLPIIVQLPVDRALRQGDPLVLTVDVQAGDDTNLHWFFNDTEIQGVNGNTLTLPSFQRSNVGRYRLRVTADKVRFFSEPIEVQINSEGEVTTLARDKLFDASTSGLVGRDAGGDDKGGGAFGAPARAVRSGAKPAGPIGDTLGFNGTQIFSTLYAQTDPAEPAHCGMTGGASYWLSYSPPADGPLTLDTLGSDFPTVLAVYTYQEPLLGYESLQSVGCDLNSGPGGTSSRLQVQVQTGRQYFIVVDGLQGGRGIAHINYSLPKSIQGTAPKLVSVPVLPPTALGSNLTWTIQASGSTPLTFLWRRGSDVLATTTNGQFQLSNVSANDAGSYSVEVTNLLGSAKSDPMELRVLLPPSIVAFTGPTTAKLGDPATIEVQFSATAPVFIAWFKDATLIDGETNAYLRFTALKLSDAGRYSVRISDTGGSVSSGPIDLSVLPPPSIVAFTGPSTAKLGDPAVFEVQFSATAPVSIAWFKDATLIDGETNASLRFTALKLSDAGRYSVRISDAGGSVTSAPIDLRVLAPPHIDVPPKKQTVQSGSTLLLSVNASGTESLQYQWYHEGTALATATNSQWEIVQIQLGQSGRYWVEVRNEAGSVTSSQAVIQVLDPPEIVGPLPAMVVWAGDWVEWNLQYTGSEPIDIEWRHNGQVLAGETSRQLRFLAESPSQAGSYSATLRNALTSSPVVSTTLSILFPAAIRFDAGTGDVVLTQPAREGEDYVLESVDHLDVPLWIEAHQGKATVNGAEVRQSLGAGSRFFRFRFAPPTP